MTAFKSTATQWTQFHVIQAWNDHSFQWHLPWFPLTVNVGNFLSFKDYLVAEKWGTNEKSVIVFNYLFHFSGLYVGFKSAKYLCSYVQWNVQKLILCINCVLRSLWKYLKPSKVQRFQAYALFERCIKLFYMILLLVDARWRCTTRYPGLPRGASNMKMYRCDVMKTRKENKRHNNPWKFCYFTFTESCT